MNNDIAEIIKQIKTGDRNQIKIAKNSLEKLWHGKFESREEKRKLLFSEFVEVIKNFDSLKNPINRTAFVQSLKMPCLIFGDEYFVLLASFLLKTAQDKNGQLRLAAVKSFEWLLLSVHHAIYDGVKFKSRKEDIEEIRLNICRLIDRVRELINKYYLPEYHRYKYVDSLPPSVYKSLQMLLVILSGGENRCEMYENYRQFKKLNELEDDYDFSEKDKWDLYYDAMDLLCEEMTKAAKRLLYKSLELDKDFVAAYVGLFQSYKIEENFPQMKKIAETGYKKTKLKFPVWPRRLIWGEIDNRQYFRAIFNMAIIYQLERKNKKAEELFRLLLKLNPGDNMGARYFLAAMFEGISPNEMEKKWDKANENQDWSEIEEMLIRQNKIHKFIIYEKEEEYFYEEGFPDFAAENNDDKGQKKIPSC